MTALRLDRLSLTNYRCFARCELELHPELTVLVAENGSGKTAVLDAAASALSVFVNALYPAEPIRKILRSDVRLVPDQPNVMSPSLPTEYDAEGTVADEQIGWKSIVRTYGDKVRPSTRHFESVRSSAQGFRSEDEILPLVAYYGTGRLWREHRLTESRRTSVTNVEERLAGYFDCLTSSSSFKGISTWFDFRMRQTASPAFRESLSSNLAMIEGVREAADKVLGPTGWSNLQWDSGMQVLTAQHDRQGRLPLLMLSDGVRTMLALVADVARRCASLNPQLSDQASVRTPGILIVDEVDMHLHPRWQQQILGLLRNAFPSLQIIVSTHSPHVLSTVDKSSIRVMHIDGGEARVDTPLLQTRGVESADVLASVMGVDPIPDLEEANLLSGYRALIEDGHAQRPDAVELRQRLNAHFGEGHPVIQECERLIRFQKFRLSKNKPEGA